MISHLCLGPVLAITLLVLFVSSSTYGGMNLFLSVSLESLLLRPWS
jgi:hypothetical protein